MTVIIAPETDLKIVESYALGFPRILLGFFDLADKT
jgi:hypothetical protein